MNKILLVIGLLAGAQAFSQEIKLLENFRSKESRADNLVDQFSYLEAAEMYEDVFKRQPERFDLAFKIADCYREINDYASAERWYYSGILEAEEVQPIIYLHYAQSLTSNENYEEARIWFQKYNEHIPEDQRAVKKLETIDNIHFHFKDSGAIELESWNINTEFDEFAPAYYYDGGVAFLSNRSSTKKFKNVLNWSDPENFDLFFTHEREDGTLADPEKFHHEITSPYHEGPLVFYEEEGVDKIIFTQNDSKKGNKGVTHLSLFSAIVDTAEHTFSNVTSLNINNKEFSHAHPAISEEFDFLIYSTNEPGGYGGSDLYISHRVGDQWGEGVNMGPIINTEGSEYFPFMMNEDELVFASNGHGGLGGLDLFRVDLSHEPYVLENLGHPFNSSKDDYAYISNWSGTEGHISSNRGSGQDDNIYKFQVVWSAYELSVADIESGELMPNIKVKIIKNGVLKETRVTNNKGYLDILAIPGEEMVLEVSKTGYITESTVLSPTPEDAGDLIPIRMTLKKEKLDKRLETIGEDSTDFAMIAKYFRQEKLIIQANNKIYEYRELGDYKYLVSGDEKILLAKTEANPDLSFIERAKEALAASNIEVQNTFDVTEIYFDYESDKIREQDLPELDKIADLLGVNPYVKVEVNAYTDSNGRQGYNDILSFKRAQSVARYLMSKGVQGSRLLVNGYGEQGIINQCEDDVECSEDQHAVNRRAEFKVLIFPEDNI